MAAFDMNTIAKYYCIPCLAKAELKAVLLDGSVSKGVFSLLASVENPGTMASSMAAVSSAEDSHSDCPARRLTERQSVGFTCCAER